MLIHNNFLSVYDVSTLVEYVNLTEFCIISETPSKTAYLWKFEKKMIGPGKGCFISVIEWKRFILAADIFNFPSLPECLYMYG